MGCFSWFSKISYGLITSFPLKKYAGLSAKKRRELLLDVGCKNYFWPIALPDRAISYEQTSPPT